MQFVALTRPSGDNAGRILQILLGTVTLIIVAVAALLGNAFRDRRPAIYFALDRGDLSGVERYLDSGMNVNTTVICYRSGYRKAPLLNIAAASGRTNVAAFLLRRGANPNAPDWQGKTPLIHAIVNNKDDTRLTLAKALIESGADPNLRDGTKYAWPPLMWAAELGRLEMAKLLISAGATVNATNMDGQTALHLAATPEIARLLIASGADPFVRAPRGTTPAESAVKNARPEVAATIKTLSGSNVLETPKPLLR